MLAQEPWIVPIPGTTEMLHLLDDVGADASAQVTRIFKGEFMLNKTHRRSILALGLMAVFLFTSASAQGTSKSKFEPLTIQEHGSFAVGGSVVTAPGTLDPINQGVFNPAANDPGKHFQNRSYEYSLH